MSKILFTACPCRFCGFRPIAVRFVSGEWGISCRSKHRGGCATRPCVFGPSKAEAEKAWATCNSAADSEHATYYRYLRDRPLDATALSEGGVFAGQVPQNVVLNGADLDASIKCALHKRLMSCT